MTGRRAMFGLCMMCALVFSAIAAQAASAGQTAFTCVEGAAKLDFVKAHCVAGEEGTKKFGHVEITEETHARLSNANTNATTNGPTNSILKETIAATNLELVATGVEGIGTLRNEEKGGATGMQASATSDANGITYTGVTVAAPAGKGCKVFEDKAGVPGTEKVVKTKPVTGRTIVTGAVHEVVIEPVTPTVFATFFIEGCEAVVPEALRGKWEITGSIKCPTNGATIVCSHGSITTQNTLKGKGFKAGLEGKATITAGKLPTPKEIEEGKSPATNPVSVTTTTP